MVCVACEAPKPAVADARYENYVVGVVQSVEAIPKKDKLSVLEVDVGEGQALKIVTNAANVKEGSRVVVAKVGAMINDDEVVKKAAVGGVPSEGMLCDAPMLGWTGGGAGAAALVPDTFEVGAPPPDSRPRRDGK